MKKIIDSHFLDKVHVQKYFFIKYGPPASGKGGIMNKVLQKKNIDQKTLVTVEVDSIIEQMDGFVQHRDNIVKAKNIDNNEQLQILYWKYRKIADNIADGVLNKALLENFNIAWETTGFQIDWTVSEINRIKKLGYTIVLVYPIVPTHMLISRAKERALKSGQIAKPSKQIQNSVEKAALNATRLIPYVDEALIYDNSGSRNQEYVALQIINNYTGERNEKYPGITKSVICKCNKVKDIKKKFNAHISKMFDQCYDAKGEKQEPSTTFIKR
jgi:predicted ABC-type ATPase